MYATWPNELSLEIEWGVQLSRQRCMLEHEVYHVRQVGSINQLRARCVVPSAFCY